MADFWTNNPVRNAGAFTTHNPTISQGAGGQTFYQILSIIELSVLSLTKILTWIKSIIVVEITISSLTKIFTWLKTISATEISIPSLTSVMVWIKSISTIEVTIPSFSEVWVRVKTLSVQGISILTLAYSITHEAVVASVATFLTTGHRVLINYLRKFR